MNPYIIYFKQYLKEHPPNYEYKDIHSLLEMFGSYYTMCNPIEPESIHNHFCSLAPILKSLSKRRERKLINTVSGICGEYERTAFQEGFRVGAQLIIELLQSE